MEKSTIIAILAGIVHTTIVLYVHFVALPTRYLGDDPVIALLGNVVRVILLFGIGAVPVYVLLRYSLVTPLLITLFATWSSLRDHVVGYTMEPFTTFYFNTVTLILTIAIIAIISLAEYGLRNWLSIFSPEPII